MNRKTFLKVLSVGMASLFLPFKFVRKAHATPSFELKQEDCTGCGDCVTHAGHCMKINGSVAEFKNDCGATGAPLNHFGCGCGTQMLQAKDNCPMTCIKEIGC